MSWEEMGKHYRNCACNSEGIVTIWEMDDWNRTREDTFLNCEKCISKYSLIITSFRTNDGENIHTYYLFPKNIKLPNSHRISLNHFVCDKNEYICNQYTLNSLKRVFKITETLTNSNNSNNFEVEKFIFNYKNNWKTQKIKTINDDLKLSIEKYNSFNTNFDITKLESDKNKKECKYLFDKYKIKV